MKFNGFNVSTKICTVIEKIILKVRMTKFSNIFLLSSLKYKIIKSVKFRIALSPY